MQPQDYFSQNVESSKQAKIDKITEAYQEEMAETKKTLKRVKQINEELLFITEKYQKTVIERIDELQQLGQLEATRSKHFSKVILSLSNIVPPIEIATSLQNLETEINLKWAEMDKKIKNLK